jgi:hypothetical protein
MWGSGKCYKTLVPEPEREKLPGESIYTWEDNIKMEVEETVTRCEPNLSGSVM